MAYEIVNSLRSRSSIRVTGNTATRINLSSLSANSSRETIVAASIGSVVSSSDGFWKIYRGNDASGTLVLDLQGSNFLPLPQIDISVANASTSNIYVTNSGAGGTLILEVTKHATYTEDLGAI